MAQLFSLGHMSSFPHIWIRGFSRRDIIALIVATMIGVAAFLSSGALIYGFGLFSFIVSAISVSISQRRRYFISLYSVSAFLISCICGSWFFGTLDREDDGWLEVSTILLVVWFVQVTILLFFSWLSYRKNVKPVA